MPFTSKIEFFLRLNAISEVHVCMTPSDQFSQPCRWHCVARCKTSLGQEVNNVTLHEKVALFRHALPDSGYLGRV